MNNNLFKLARVNNIFDLFKIVKKDNKLIKQKTAELLDIYKNYEYFSFKILDDLALPFNIAFILGSRNSGKTTAFFELVRNLKEGEMFVLMRTTAEQMRNMAIGFNADVKCPFTIIGQNIYKRKYIKNKDGTNAIVTKKKDLVLIGRAMAFSTAANYNSTISGNMFKFMFFDEFISMDYKKIYEVNGEKLLQLASSISRDSTDFKIYLTGNNFEESIIMNDFKINRESDLDYINMKGVDFNILYINTKNHLSGVKRQQILRGAILLSKKLHDNLNSNRRPLLSDMVIIEKEILNVFEDWNYIAYDKYVFSIKTYRIYIDELKQHRVVYLLTRDIFKYLIDNDEKWQKVLTPSPILSSLYGFTYMNERRFNFWKRTIKNLMISRNIFFDMAITAQEFMEMDYHKVN